MEGVRDLTAAGDHGNPVQARNGWTALIIAVLCGYEKMVRL